MRTTIKDIAQATGLSITTVSLVLNSKGKKISAAHRKLVEDTAQRLGYRPNRLAVGLLKKKTNTIGLIVPDISNVFFSELTKGIEDAGREAGYNLILCNSNDKQALELEYIDTMADRGVDGMIVAMSAESYGGRAEESFSALRKYGIPAIIVDCFSDVDDFSTVAIDNEKGSRLAVEYLLELGHRRIGCITGPLGPKTNDNRLAGYTEALRGRRIEYDRRLVYEGDFRYQSGYAAVPALLEQKPTAIFCLNDLMAYGAVKGLRERGLRIPEDVSVMGFDNIFFSEMMDVPLSTVEQPVYQMGGQAARILVEEMGGREERRHILFEPALKIRQSTRAPEAQEGTGTNGKRKLPVGNAAG